MGKLLPLVADALGQMSGGQVHIMAVTSVPQKKGNVQCIMYVFQRRLPLRSNSFYRADSADEGLKYSDSHTSHKEMIIKPFVRQYVARLSKTDFSVNAFNDI
jgi:hypothetical protein